MSRTPVTPTTFPPKGAVRNRNDADMPPSGGESLKSRPASHVPPAERLRAKDLARMEGCSPGTARKLMRSGSLGRIHGRNRRDRWIDASLYHRYIDTL